MWKLLVCRVTCSLLLLTLLAQHSRSDEPPWGDTLALDGGGYWHARLLVTTTNHGESALDGFPVDLQIDSKNSLTAPLVGTPCSAIRVTDAVGVELLFQLYGPDGEPADKGNIQPGSRVVFPVACRAGDRHQLHLLRQSGSRASARLFCGSCWSG